MIEWAIERHNVTIKANEQNYLLSLDHDKEPFDRNTQKILCCLIMAVLISFNWAAINWKKKYCFWFPSYRAWSGLLTTLGSEHEPILLQLTTVSPLLWVWLRLTRGSLCNSRLWVRTVKGISQEIRKKMNLGVFIWVGPPLKLKHQLCKRYS